MNRVSLVAVLAMFAGASAAQPVHIGRLSPNSAEADVPYQNAFREGLRELGWQEGRDYEIDARFADGRADRLPPAVAELIALNVQVLLVGSTPGAQAARAATKTVPIVMVTTGDPVEAGLTKSLARPDGNLTGFTALAQDLNVKRLELLKEAVPGLAHVAILTGPPSAYRAAFMREKDKAASALAMQFSVSEAPSSAALEDAFAAVARSNAHALLVVNDPLLLSERKRIVAHAEHRRLPAIYGEREFVEAGGLMFYGASLVDLYHRAAGYAHRIVKGARPDELPIEQPTKFELVVNQKAARAIGLKLPASLLARADRVIE
jgi:putative ABC transport system substrate-binding protein